MSQESPKAFGSDSFRCNLIMLGREKENMLFAYLRIGVGGESEVITPSPHYTGMYQHQMTCLCKPTIHVLL